MNIEEEDISYLNAILETIVKTGDGYDFEFNINGFCKNDPEFDVAYNEDTARFNRLFEILYANGILEDFYHEDYLGRMVKTETARLFLKNKNFQEIFIRQEKEKQVRKTEEEKVLNEAIKISNEARLTELKVKWFPLTIIIAFISAIITIIGLILK